MEVGSRTGVPEWFSAVVPSELPFWHGLGLVACLLRKPPSNDEKPYFAHLWKNRARRSSQRSVLYWITISPPQRLVRQPWVSPFLPFHPSGCGFPHVRRMMLWTFGWWSPSLTWSSPRNKAMSARAGSAAEGAETNYPARRSSLELPPVRDSGLICSAVPSSPTKVAG